MKRLVLVLTDGIARGHPVPSRQWRSKVDHAAQPCQGRCAFALTQLRLHGWWNVRHRSGKKTAGFCCCYETSGTTLGFVGPIWPTFRL
jgi:hypothetical protein